MFNKIMLKYLNYKEIRALQICTVFSITVGIQLFFHFPRSGWIGFTVMMIYVGFDNGTALFRTYHRFWGVILGLFLGYLLCLLAQVNYQSLFFSIPLVVFLAYFFLGKDYSVPTVFMVSGSVLEADFFSNQTNFSTTFYLIDYFVCTLIAFFIVIIFEYFVFKRFNLMKRFIREHQKKLINSLRNLILLLEKNKVRRSVWYEGCIAVINHINIANDLMRNAEFEYVSEIAVGDEFNQFIKIVNRVFIKLQSIYSSYYAGHDSHYSCMTWHEEIQADLLELERLIPKIGKRLNISSEAYT